MTRPFNLPIVILLLGWAFSVNANDDYTQVGLGAYAKKTKGSDIFPPAAPYRSEQMMQRAATTNQWYSSLIFSAEPAVIFATPLTVKPTLKGFEMALPSKSVIPTSRGDVEIHYPHTNPIIFQPVSFTPKRIELANASDWSIDVAMRDGVSSLNAVVSHGSPYVYFETTDGDIAIQLPANSKRIEYQDGRVLLIQTGDKRYGVFGPTGVQWVQKSTTEWFAKLPEGKRYFSCAALPDNEASTVLDFLTHAYAFIKNTNTEWRYDAETSKVTTQFTATTKIMEGADSGLLIGLYPHHWYKNEEVVNKTKYQYETIRGLVRLLAANQFITTRRYSGVLPYWPKVAAGKGKEQFEEVMNSDIKQARSMMLPMGEGPYWQGKGLQRITQLMAVVEQQGNLEGRDKLLKMSKARFEQWFSGESRRTYFHYDKGLGTVVGYPEEYFSVKQMNDHHFHYGYWIRAAADIALRDPEWAASEKWGGMIDLLIKDIATQERGRADFPFLRNFDIYEGHSWASGLALGDAGNNQESSSEAVNAWAGLIMWGEIKGDKRLRDLGVWLYTSEIESIQHYWFDIHNIVLAPEYKNVEVSMLFGGKYAHNTWWIDEPRQIHGINLLPMTAASTYLASSPEFILRNLEAMNAESAKYTKKVDPADIWADIFLQYLALAKPQEALAKWTRWGYVEFGDTRTHTLHWLYTMNERGTPALDITANTPLYGVFKTGDGTRTYLVYNASKTPQQVQFSDGMRVTALPRALTESKNSQKTN